MDLDELIVHSHTKFRYLNAYNLYITQLYKNYLCTSRYQGSSLTIATRQGLFVISLFHCELEFP